jgi:hypothetical protein
MVLPGIQALFGFQLIAAFSERFSELDSVDRTVHIVSLLLTALSIALIMTPAAYHRICESGRTSLFFTRLASVLVAAAMVPLLVSISLDVYIVTRLVLSSGSIWPAAILGGATFAVFLALWIIFPYSLLARTRRRGATRLLGRWSAR